jgi:hypothetical protein
MKRCCCGQAQFSEDNKMTPQIKTKLASGCCMVICILLLLKYGVSLDNSEFPSGRITGVLLEFYNAGLYLYIATLLLVFVWPRIAAVVASLGALLCSPVLIYAIVPGLFRRIFPGEYKVCLTSNFIFDKWAFIVMLVIALTSFVNFRILFEGRRTLGDRRDVF